MIIDEILDKGLKNIKKDDQSEVKQDLYKAVKESLLRQFEGCNLYRQICKQKNFNPRKDLQSVDDFANIPYITTANFKQQKGSPKKLLTVPESEIQVWSRSTGTSGDPSIVGRDHTNVLRYVKMFNNVVEDVGLSNYKWSLLFLPEPQKEYEIDEKIEIPTVMFSLMMNFVNTADEKVFCLKIPSPEEIKKGKRFEFDAQTTFGFLATNPGSKGKGWISGSVPLMYMTLNGYHQKTGQTFDVGKDSVILGGGGWKSFQGDAISPVQFREDMAKILGISSKNVRDIYSFSESDILFVECEEHNKHCYPWGDIIVRDVETLEPVEVGEKGLANLINPLAHSYAGVSILQDDIVRITGIDDCPCGRKGKMVDCIGRAEGAEAKGCGVQLADETIS
ncbi:MAG: putative Acyl-protein synthetase, luxE [Promethearchaeota archaeon]|nr:MAG: putative Acyl-protein synthetase, luxE [Candidatus Lokiarchaeota archaeon]